MAGYSKGSEVINSVDVKPDPTAAKNHYPTPSMSTSYWVSEKDGSVF